MDEKKPKFHSGDKVFAKMKGYPHWPARIIAIMNETSNNRRYHVYFYGTNQTAVVKGDNICSYIDNKTKLGKTKKHRYFNEALLEIEAELNANIKDTTKNSKTPKKANNLVKNTTKSSSSTTPSTKTKPPSTGNKKTKQKTNSDTKPNLKRKLVHTDIENKHSKPKKSRKSSTGNRKRISDVTADESVAVKSELVTPTRDVDNNDLIKDTPIKKEDQTTVKKNQAKPIKERKRDYIIATRRGEKIKIPLNLNQPQFSVKGKEVNWRKEVLDYANSLKKRIENGEEIDNVHDLMNDWTTMKSFDYIHQKLNEENNRKLKFLRIEAQLLDIDIEIKNSLSLSDATPEKCIDLLDQLNNLEITPLMLKKQPDVLLTIRRMRNYVGNISCWNLTNQELKKFKGVAKRIRKKAVILYNKFKTLFVNRSIDHFWNYFTKEVDSFRAKTSDLTLTELLSIVDEPV